MTAMTPADVAEQLDIKPSTLRKYSLLLEEQGVPFDRNANKSRKYTDMHLMALQKMIALLDSGGVSVEDAVFTASKWFMGDTSTTVNIDNNNATNNGVERHSDDIATAMISEIRSLKAEIIEQRELINKSRIAQDERDLVFVEILEKLQTEITLLNERALPEPEEEIEEEPEELTVEKSGVKSFFARLFK